MREIKFKGKAINRENTWFVGDLRIDGDKVWIVPFDETPGVDKHRVYPDTVGQFIGVRDKNGKDIYEGDWAKVPKWTAGHKCKDCGYQEKTDAYGKIEYQETEELDFGSQFAVRFSIRINDKLYSLDGLEDLELGENIEFRKVQNDKTKRRL